jgi:hypothetical protein
MIPVLAAIGALGVLNFRGWRDALGFVLGAVISAVNFRWLHRLVDGLHNDGKQRSTNRLAWLMGLRYLLFGGVGYAIIIYFRITPLSLLAGLLVVVAAVMLEILYELIYARA